jgi:hypothetical protein
MGFLFLLLLLLVGYIVIRYRETTFPLIKRALIDFQADVEKFQTKRQAQSTGPNLPYQQKEPFFNQSELVFFQILNGRIDAHRFTIFPKVRLADIVAVAKVNGKKPFGAWNKIKAKHIDYVIWDLVESKVVMVIELDGNSHNGNGAKKNDAFKDELFAKVGLSLVRVAVGSDFETEAQKIAEQLGH